jgi:pyruvate/2-oxoacid:ferredoxin oxidoreductase beta subunit
MTNVHVSQEGHSHTDHALWRAGNGACAGCGMSLGLQWLDDALDGEQPTMVVPACCAVVTPGSYPTTAFGVPAVATTFASSPSVATGISRVRALNAEGSATICWAGDGGTYDIGLATLSGAAERNEDMIYICYDNEIYGNTGGQRSGATPQGAVTSTTPAGKKEAKKDVLGIMTAHDIPYAATLSLAHKDDLLRKLRVAASLRGFRFLLLHSPCPTGWKSDPAESVELVRLAVASGIFPLYEVFDGRRYRVNLRPDGTDVAAYFAHQGRFRKGTLDLERVRAAVAADWARLDTLARVFPAEPAAV